MSCLPCQCPRFSINLPTHATARAVYEPPPPGSDRTEARSRLEDFAAEVLRDIADRRPSVPIVEEEPLWDTMGMMWVTLLLLCTEYFFRHRWLGASLIGIAFVIITLLLKIRQLDRRRAAEAGAS